MSKRAIELPPPFTLEAAGKYTWVCVCGVYVSICDLPLLHFLYVHCLWGYCIRESFLWSTILHWPWPHRWAILLLNVSSCAPPHLNIFSDSRAVTCMRCLCFSLVTHLMPRWTPGGPLARPSGSAQKAVGQVPALTCPWLHFPGVRLSLVFPRCLYDCTLINLFSCLTVLGICHSDVFWNGIEFCFFSVLEEGGDYFCLCKGFCACPSCTKGKPSCLPRISPCFHSRTIYLK